ncbi:hypothetical protein [Leifsonia shinshuensis]|uniref:hypothetical protein n=1 Tax=Leifsonia shinshuensis TaxID=150026 RepID=UPI0028630665|nr:hypothetical protein [Leifsonia shinshuensis]MDR6971406.1 hypothetical protein [Leifsonia shinshuensis]
MTTDEQYLDIANSAYSVDPLRQDPPLASGTRFTAGTGDHTELYEVLATENNAANGFQAMAVAPVVNGRVDSSDIVVSYAGTNPDHRADVLADAQSVVGDHQGAGTQVLDAKLFAERIRQSHPGATITTNGHSLGAFLALLVAAENGWSATAFNGPDPWEWLSPAAKERVRNDIAAGRNRLTNYVNEWDVVGNLYADRTGAAVYVSDKPGRPPLDYHNIGRREGFRVGPDGSIAGAGAKGRRLDAIVANALHRYAPGVAQALGPAFTGLVAGLRNPAAMEALGSASSSLIVTVNSVSALALAASIGGTTTSLMDIKAANSRLIPRMEDGLRTAQNAAALLPCITAQDIATCTDVHRLHVHQNIDEDAVRHVDRLVSSHIARVADISDGITRSVRHTIEQDAQWALALATE